MLAYHNDPAIKALYLERVKQHRIADELFQHFGYWKDGIGCAVGCTIHSNDHVAYEKELGIPIMLARLEDSIFEGLSAELANAWPERFLSAIEPGADLSRVGWKLLHWFLTNKQINPGIDHPVADKSIKGCADVLEPLCNGLLVNADEAWGATRVAESALISAEEIEEWAVKWSVESAAESSKSAALSTENIEVSADWAAWSVESAVSSAGRAMLCTEKAAWSLISDKLIELISQTS